MPKVVAFLLLLAITGYHAYTLQTRSSPSGCMDPVSQPERLVSSSLCQCFVKALQLADPSPRSIRNAHRHLRVLPAACRGCHTWKIV